MTTKTTTTMKCPNGHEEKSLIQIYDFIYCDICRLYYSINEMLIEYPSSKKELTSKK